MYIVSSCLAGYKCRYDGKSNDNTEVKKIVCDGEAICVCPEQAGGMVTPREPAEIVGGDGGDVLDGKARVVTRSGKDVTAEFVAGARETLRICELYGVKDAVLKARSPSCGCEGIYDGTFSGTLCAGSGVTAELLVRSGIKVRREN